MSSGVPCSPRLRGTRKAPSRSAATMKGRFTANTAFQLPVLEHEAAEQRPDGRAAATDAGPQRHGLGPLVGREDVGDDRQGRRHDHGRAGAHDDAGDDDLLGGLRHECCVAGGEPEQHQTDLQDALAAVAVTEVPGGEQQSGEHQRVRVDHPLQLGGRGVELLAQARQRHVERGVADHDDQQAQAQHAEGPPPAAEHLRVDAVGDVELGVGVHGPGVLSGWFLHRCTPDGMKWQLCHMA